MVQDTNTNKGSRWILGSRIPRVESVKQTKCTMEWELESTEQTNTKSQTVAVTKTGIKY